MAVAAKIARSHTDAKASTKQPGQARAKHAKSAVQSRATVHRKPLGDEEANRRSGLLTGGAGVLRKALPEEEQVQRKALPEEEKIQRKALPEEEQVQRKALPEEEKVQRKPEDYLEDKKKAQATASGKNIQAASFISSPGDASEREADRVADAVTAPRAASSPPVGRSIMRALRKDVGGEGPPVAAANDNVEAKIKAAAVGGKPLSKKTRALLEPRFGADFSEVRIHDDDQAGKLSSRIGARAFTFGRHVFFNAGQYQPDTPSGQKLLAHELTHTIQQRAAVQRKYDGLTSSPKVSESTGTQASRLGISDALDYFADAAYNIPGYRMFTIMIGINPINMREVEATTANILRAIVEFLPGGGLITTVLDQWGIFETVGTWVDEQLKTLGISGTSIKAALDEFLDTLGWSDIFDLGGVWDRAVSIFSTPIDRVITFIGSLFTQILEFVQQAVLSPLAALVSETAGYALLTQILGFDPITGAPVERTAEGIVGGLLTLAGQEELWNNIQEANALDRIWEWFGTALDSLIALVMGIPDRFIEALATIEITEFLDLPAAIFKVLGVFANIVIDFGAWILETVFTLLTIIIDVVAPGLMGYLEKAGKAFDTIVNDPIGFVGNLVNAAKLGLDMFVGNFVPNLKAALVGWLTGALAGANLHIPQAFTIQEILKFVLSVLGLTWDNIRTKLVREIGETAVSALETGFELVRTLITEGPAAAWEQIVESIGNLKDMVIDQVIDFVMDRVITAAVTRLVSFLNPAGALVQAIIAIYNTIMFFVERLSQMAQVAAAFIDSIADIASGKIEPAATKVEQTMVGLLSLVISFLARLVGLGNVGEAITGLIDRLRRPIDEALDKVVVWIVTQARRLGGAIRAGVASVVSWWRERQTVPLADGNEHTLSFEGGEGSARLTLASAPKPVEQHLEEASTDPGLPASAQARAQAALDFYRTNLKPIENTDTTNIPSALEPLIANVASNINRLAVMLREINPATVAPFPNAEFEWNGPRIAKAAKLSNRTSRGGRDARSGNPKGWSLIERETLTQRNGRWVRMHMISAAYGGLDVDGNELPAPTADNTGSVVRGFEQRIEQSLYGDRSPAAVRRSSSLFSDVAARPPLIWLETSSTGFHSAVTNGTAQYDGATFASGVEFKAGIYYDHEGNGDWTRDNAALVTASLPIDRPDFSGEYIHNANSIGRDELVRQTQIRERFARDILAERANGSFASNQDFFNRMMAFVSNREGRENFMTDMTKVTRSIAGRRIRWG